MNASSHRLRKFLSITVLALAATGFALAIGWRTAWPVQGVDVSAWQGEIDWQRLAANDIDFAFIKATEGSTFRDPRFAANWKEAHRTRLAIGAYHFFSFDSPGITQAENFIATVPAVAGMLPPVVDVEFYGGHQGRFERGELTADAVREQLKTLLDALEAHYGLLPILYVVDDTYDAFIVGAFDDHPLWIRALLRSPRLPAGRRWTFWQFFNRGIMPGYTGRETFIDLNVFNGNAAELRALGAKE